jgi:hypothetical protein
MYENIGSDLVVPSVEDRRRYQAAEEALFSLH